MAQLADSSDFVARSAAHIFPLVYDELRELARIRIARLCPGQTLTPTELVHETYLRMVGSGAESFEGRRHFFFAAIRAMRDIIVEAARRKSSLKRGGQLLRVDLDGAAIVMAAPWESILDLNSALDKLEHESPDRAQLVQLRYFGGLTLVEIAEVTGLSLATLKRRWTYSRAWLQRELSQSSPNQAGR
jgi:RNA polymerase sigma factor (TIGR02999 family)